jgi:hypothetical protein
MRLALNVLLVLIVLSAGAAGAQTSQAREPNCTYQACALGLAPVWNGLEVTRGDSQRRVTNLNFFVPVDISNVFAEDREARDVARDAFRIRQVGAVLTDAGLILGATGLGRALFQRDWDTFSSVLVLAGGASLAAGVPFQFAADGTLSRAVWLFNRRFAR